MTEPEPTFELILLGYRNDLARERTIAFLRRLPDEIAGIQDLHRDTPLPYTVVAAIDHDRGLRMVAQLRERGAQVRLQGLDQDLSPHIRPPASPAARSSRPLVLGLALLIALAALHYNQPPGPALPPPPLPNLVAQIGAAALPIEGQSLNEEAVVLNAAGNFREAAERLRAAIEKTPHEDILYENLVTVLRNWAVSEINSGRPAAAVTLLRESLDLSRDDPGLLALTGIAQERLGDWHDAEDTLQRALRFGTRDPMAFVALGRVYRQQGDRQGAVEMFQRAREIGAAGAEFESMLARLERELDAEWDFAEFSTPHFRLSFPQGEDRAAAHTVSQVLEDAYFAVGRKLDLFPDTPTEVVLYAAEDFHTVTQTPDWTGGVFDGRIKLPVRGIEGGSKLLERTVRHEYGHVLVTKLSNGMVPVWLNEGLAIWAEEESDGDREDWAYETIGGEHLFSLSELEPPFTRSTRRTGAGRLRAKLSRDPADPGGVRRTPPPRAAASHRQRQPTARLLRKALLDRSGRIRGDADPKAHHIVGDRGSETDSTPRLQRPSPLHFRRCLPNVRMIRCRVQAKPS